MAADDAEDAPSVPRLESLCLCVVARHVGDPEFLRPFGGLLLPAGLDAPLMRQLGELGRLDAHTLTLLLRSWSASDSARASLGAPLANGAATSRGLGALAVQVLRHRQQQQSADVERDEAPPEPPDFPGAFCF